MPTVKKIVRFALTLIASIVKMFVLTVGFLIVLFIGIVLYQIDRQADAGKAWCESIIREYEQDQRGFLVMHSDKPNRDGLVLHPSHDYEPARGRFIVYSTGEYVCSYHHGGFMFPHGYEYSSKTRVWKYID